MSRGSRCSCSTLGSGQTLSTTAWLMVWLGFVLSLVAVVFDDLGNVLALLQATVTLLVATVESRRGRR
ncbi:hypothetical protein LWC34_51950 [Kibdelosporangium philippinense]|uniref:Uncharacterized protein n=1 Tax=Kibdelosporangium philippinense TaxID=211113 RepID=A0ABS8ZU54_9PSEU|nr:hypothetical protein [Kibdelosporangium philippinense]MCE7011269.1 hypothetical protein [Kibdelosporangium philippinense]